MAFAPVCRAPEHETAGPAQSSSPAGPRPSDFGMGLLFDLVHDAVVVASLRSSEIVLWNPAAEQLFGYTADEAIGQPIDILMPACIATLHRAAVERYVHTGRGLIIDANTPVEVPALTKSGVDLRVQVSLRELRGPRGDRYVVAVMRDTSHRREAELMRLEMDRVRRVGETLLSALAAATHEPPPYA